MWIVTDEEIAAVVKLNATRRYAYCIKKIADQQRLIGLISPNGWALAGDDDGNQLIPIWPHERYAVISATGPWKGYTPKSIDISEWLARWTSGMEKDQRLVAVFPIIDDKGIPISPIKFAEDLQSELNEYE